MTNQSTTRVAVAQHATGTDLEENLATCQRMIRQAGECNPDVLVLPEFANHVAWYDDAEHAYEVALDLDGWWVKGFGEAVADIGAWTQVNCTVRRTGGKVGGTNLFFAPDGSLVEASDKQVLMGNENNFLERASVPRPVVDTDFGAIGLYACMEGVICEPARSLALRGARLLLNSLNSFALDEASLHIPVRAAENRVFVAASNKVGSIVPESKIEEVSAKLKVPPEMLHGGGESQVIAPDGTVLVMASRDKEEIVFADIDLSRADDKRRPDGTDVFAVRRPELYRAMAESPDARPLGDMSAGAQEVSAAVVQLDDDGTAAGDLLDEAIGNRAKLIVLPELHMIPDGAVLEPAVALEQSAEEIEAITDHLGSLGTDALVACSVVSAAGDGFAHEALLIGREGVVHRQAQLHRTERHPWVTQLADRLDIFESPWGRVVMLVGDDAVIPETGRLAAVLGAEIALMSYHAQESWELEFGIIERAAENRLNLVASSRPTGAGAGIIIDLPADFTLWVERDRPFDGTINFPDVTRAPLRSGVTTASIHPAHAANKMLSHATDLVNGRPWQLLDALVN